MLDVHPPHEKIHGFRDFLLHLLTITIGLLIALGLEAAVERMHHHRQRDEAEATLRQEMLDNQSQLATSHGAIAKERANLIQAMHFLEAKQAGKPFDISGISLSFTLVPMNDAGWRTASATGLLSYMQYDDVKRYAAAYHMQDEFAAMQKESLDSFLQLHSYLVGKADPTQISPEEARTGMQDLHHAYAHLDAMDDIGTTLSKSYKDALGGH